MALGDLTISQLSAVAEESADHEDGDRNNDDSFDVVAAENEMTMTMTMTTTTTTTTETSMAYVPQFVWFRELRHDEFEAYVPTAPANTGLVSKWRIKDRMKTGCVALVLCLNISVPPPDVIRVSPCAQMQCWIGRANRFWKSSHQPRGSKGFLMFYPHILCVCSSYKEDGEKFIMTEKKQGGIRIRSQNLSNKILLFKQLWSYLWIKGSMNKRDQLPALFSRLDLSSRLFNTTTSSGGSSGN
ncbi:hypothetical protein MTR67_045187 [Solanum verrucosum]|uniref:Raptor N-terminal CASPase-like domain-containing protein n=1 Tax=Solanum verrucosum TaxID=315347 RepID=A0AAF0USJ0_SOLVR|nr:hypothetical protein MTR67_045187 [Solanum verrucosum]